jgi:hypothetical protein
MTSERSNPTEALLGSSGYKCLPQIFPSFKRFDRLYSCLDGYAEINPAGAFCSVSKVYEAFQCFPWVRVCGEKGFNSPRLHHFWYA